MSVRRLVLTSIGMASVGLLLAAVAPTVGEVAAVLAAPQRTVDAAGAETLVLAAAGAAAWAVWVWGALGLALTALSAVPGLAGAAARLLLRGVLPAGARRAAALALGLGLGVAAPVLAGVPIGAAPALAASITGPAVPDWPEPGGAAVPDWPPGGAADSHVVVRGDCLWAIAGSRLRQAGAEPTDADVAAAVQAWWSANAAVIGSDPDLILPGQVLRPPTAA